MGVATHEYGMNVEHEIRCLRESAELVRNVVSAPTSSTDVEEAVSMFKENMCECHTAALLLLTVDCYTPLMLRLGFLRRSVKRAARILRETAEPK